MDLRELRLIVSRHLPIAFIVFNLCALAGFAAAFVPAKTYRTTATIVVDVNNDPSISGGSVQQASFLLPAIEERAKSRALRERAANDVPDRLRNVRVVITTASDASVMRIRGESSSAAGAQAWVNAIADRLVEEQAADSPVVLGVLDPAPLKKTAAAPRPALILTAFLMMGVIAALFSTLIADRLKRAFDTQQTVRDQLGTTVLGELPALRRRSEQWKPIVGLLSQRRGGSEVADAYERLAANVEFRMAQVGADRVAVVSIGESRTNAAITAGLGWMLAVAGRRVVVIEADLRRPMLADQLGVTSKAGLSDIAAYGIDSLVLQETTLPSLKLLAAGSPAGRAADAVAASLPDVLASLSDGSNTILIDTAPLDTPESAITIASTEHVILVVSDRVDVERMANAVDSISDAGGGLLGVVLENVPRRRMRRRASLDRSNASTNAGDGDESMPVDATDVAVGPSDRPPGPA